MTVTIKNLFPINVHIKFRKIISFIAVFSVICFTLSNRPARSDAGMEEEANGKAVQHPASCCTEEERWL